MADIKLKRGQESKVGSLAKEDGSVIFGYGASSQPTTMHFDVNQGGTVQRTGIAVSSASSANLASTAIFSNKSSSATIASTATYSKNSGALGGSSLSQILNSAGSGSAFVGLDATTNNVVKLTRANGGTVQKTINNVANATSASIANTARLASTAIYSSYNLPYQVASQHYVTNDTHVMKYGYLKCDGSFQNITLLVTSAFLGNQHGSAYLINLQQDTNDTGSGSIHFTAQAIKIGGNATREYYAYADQTNKRLYLYGKVTGGNSYGKWNVTVLQSSGGYDNWVSDFAYNQSLPSGYSTISQIYPGTAQNSNALGGSSLSQILSQSGNGSAFTSLDTATNNVIKLTRANGGTVQKTINNVANATSASIALTAKVANKIGTATVGSATKPIYLNDGTPTQLTSITSSFAAVAQDLENTNLNDVRSPGEYFGGDGNSCANKPANVDAFALEVRRAADGWYVQIMYASNNQQKTYIRYYNGGSWTSWVTETTSTGNNAYNTVSVTDATLSFGRLNGATGTTVTVNNVTNATSAANANLLNGIDSSRFIYGSGAHGVNSSFSNASSIWKSGFYDLSSTGGTSAGLPTTTAWHWLIEAGHRSNSSTYRCGLQIAAPNNTDENLYYRINPQSGNGTWHTVLDEHNLATYTTQFVKKSELGSGSSTGTLNVDAARRIVNSDVSTRNAQSFRVGTPGSGSWTGFPSSYLYSASSTAALKTNAYYRQQVGVLHVAAGTAYHDLVFADAGTDNGIVRVSSKGDTGLILDTTNYATYSTRYNALSSSTLTVTTAGGVNIDGGSY